MVGGEGLVRAGRGVETLERFPARNAGCVRGIVLVHFEKKRPSRPRRRAEGAAGGEAREQRRGAQRAALLRGAAAGWLLLVYAPPARTLHAPVVVEICMRSWLRTPSPTGGRLRRARRRLSALEKGSRGKRLARSRQLAGREWSIRPRKRSPEGNSFDFHTPFPAPQRRHRSDPRAGAKWFPGMDLKTTHRAGKGARCALGRKSAEPAPESQSAGLAGTGSENFGAGSRGHQGPRTPLGS